MSIANCSNESSTTDSGSGTCAELMSVYCRKHAECDPIGIRRDYGDVQGCIARQSLACPALSLPGTAWVATKVQRCTDQLRSAPSCYGDYDEPEACEDEPGTLIDGKPCEQSSQCAGGRCERGFVRLPDGGESVPACGVCRSRDAGSSSGGCGNAGSCSAGQRCVFDSNTRTSSCAAIQSEGAPCSATSPCDVSLFCRLSADAGSTGLCSKRGARGASCSGLGECATMDGLQCIAGKCESPTFVAIGEACDSSGRICEKGARCVYSSSTSMGTCQAAAEDGAHCGNDIGCRFPANCFDNRCLLPGDGHCQ